MICPENTENCDIELSYTEEPDSASYLQSSSAQSNDTEHISVSNNQIGEDEALRALTVEEVRNCRVQKRIMYLAVFLVNLNALFFAASNIGVKYLMERGAGFGDLFLMRSIIMFFVSSLLMWAKKTKPTVLRPQAKWLIVRIIFGLSGFCSFKIAIGFLPLSLLMIVYQTNPFWTSVLSYLVIREEMKRFEVGAMVLCFAGIVCIAASESFQFGGDIWSVVGMILAFVTAWLTAG